MAASVPVVSKVFDAFFSSKDFKLEKKTQVDMTSKSIPGIGASSNPRRSNQDRFLAGKVNAEVTQFLDSLLDHENLTEHGWLFLQIFNKLMATKLKSIRTGGACVAFAYNGQNGGFGFLVGDTEFKVASAKDGTIRIPLCEKTHHADVPEEIKRFEKFKPFECVERDCDRVLRIKTGVKDKSLHPTHTYGDYNARDYGLSTSPIISSWPTLKADESVWLHSDGATDILNRGKTVAHDADLKKMADDLCYNDKTSDDVTVLILKENSTLGFIADGHGEDGARVADLAVDNVEKCLIQAMDAVNYVARIEKGERTGSTAFPGNFSDSLFAVLATRNSPVNNYEQVLLDICKHNYNIDKEIIALAPLSVLNAIKRDKPLYYDHQNQQFFDLLISCKENKSFNNLQALIIELMFCQSNPASLDEVDMILETMELPGDTKKKIYEFLGITNQFIIDVSRWDFYREPFQILVTGSAKEIFDKINEFPQAFIFDSEKYPFLERLLRSNEKLVKGLTHDELHNLLVELFTIIIYKSHLKNYFEDLRENKRENLTSLRGILNYWRNINHNLLHEFSELEIFSRKLSQDKFDNFFTEAFAFEQKLDTFMEHKCTDFINKISGKTIVASSAASAAIVYPAAASAADVLVSADVAPREAKGSQTSPSEFVYGTTVLDLTGKPKTSFLGQIFKELFTFPDGPIIPDRQTPVSRL